MAGVEIWQEPEGPRHAGAPDGNDYTLCGFALEGLATGEADELQAVTRGRVTCSQCIAILRYAKAFPAAKIGRALG